MADDAPATTTATSSATAEPTTVVATPAPASWRDTLPDELKAEKSLESFKGVPDLAKAFVETKRMVGQKFAPPGKDAKPEDVAAFRKAMGVPEAPDGYALEIPEIALEMGWDAAIEKDFRATMHALGAPAPLVSEIVNYYGKMEMARNEAATAEAKALGAKLKQEWGLMYEPRMARVNRMIADAELGGGPELVQAFQTAGHVVNAAGRHPLIIKLLGAVADNLYEAGTLQGEGLGGLSQAEAEQKLTTLRSELKNLPEGNLGGRREALIDEIASVTRIARSGR